MARADPMKGEATLAGKLLRMNFSAWRAFEKSSGKKLTDLMWEIGVGLGCEELIAWLRAFAVDEMTEDETVALIEAAGHPQTVKALNGLVETYFGDLVKGSAENPPKAA